MDTFLYRAIYTTASTASFSQQQSELSFSKDLTSRFSQIYTKHGTNKAQVRRSDRTDVESSDQTGALRGSASLASESASSLDGNSSFISPASRIVGRFQELLELDFSSNFLCEYVEVVKGKRDRLFVVAEHFKNNLALELAKPSSDASSGFTPNPLSSVETIRRVTFELLIALSYLHAHSIVHRNLSLENVQLDADFHVRLAEFGLYYIAQAGANVNFSLSTVPRYMPPEVLLGTTFSVSTAKADVWAFGIIFLELIAGHQLFNATSNSEEIDKVSALFSQDLNVSQQRIHNLVHSISLLSSTVTPEALEIINSALLFSPSDRPSTWELLRHPWYSSLLSQHFQENRPFYIQPYCISLHAQQATEIERLRTLQRSKLAKFKTLQEFNSFESLKDIFQFWQLTGCNLEQEMQLQCTPPILRMPLIVRVDGSVFPHPAEQPVITEPSLLNDSRIFLISLKEFFHKLKAQTQQANRRNTMPDAELPPLSAREHDLEYQNFRVQVFRDLLSKWPQSREQLTAQARVDIPPLLRAQVWRRLLDINDKDVPGEYQAIDKESDGPSDHQIELDIPRCHQYHHLLSSPEGHCKFRRILKAWVAANPQLSYWQGIDSVLAPFLVRHFNNEAYAYACLNALTKGPLRLFFGKSNAQYLQEHLLLFRQLLAYHDPELGIHLHSIGFEPELFGIPWFLTLFTHIFSLDKVYPIWDTLLLDPYRLPLFFAVALMVSLRASLLALDFNNTLLFISNLPAIDFEYCLKLTVRYYDRAPPSLSMHLPLYDTSQPTPSDTELVALLAKAKEYYAPQIQQVDIDDGKIHQPFLLLDVRKPSEFKASHYPGSITLNHKDPTLAWLEPYRKSDIVIVVHPSYRDQTIKFANNLISPPHSFPYISVFFWKNAPIVKPP